MLVAIATGAVIGAAYTLSPATICFLAVLPILFIWAGHGLEGRERLWVFGILAVAVLARLAVLAAFFLHTDHFAQPFGVLVPDEWFLKTRSLWIHDVALGVPIAPSDWTDFYGSYGKTGFLWALASFERPPQDRRRTARTS